MERRIVNGRTGGEKGQKDARFDLIPADALWALAEHYGRGSAKYADRNWEKGIDYSLLFASLQRHVWAWWGGENVDPDSGAHHLSAVVWHALSLLAFEMDPERYASCDDRPTRPAQ